MRTPNEVHTSGRWRIRELAPDFTLEDVWALPAHGRAEDFPALIELATAADPADSDSLPARALWLARDLLGRWSDWAGSRHPRHGVRRTVCRSPARTRSR